MTTITRTYSFKGDEHEATKFQRKAVAIRKVHTATRQQDRVSVTFTKGSECNGLMLDEALYYAATMTGTADGFDYEDVDCAPAILDDSKPWYVCEPRNPDGSLVNPPATEVEDDDYDADAAAYFAAQYQQQPVVAANRYGHAKGDTGRSANGVGVWWCNGGDTYGWDGGTDKDDWPNFLDSHDCVRVKLRGGKAFKPTARRVDYWDWSDDGSNNDIVEFELI